jgi:hypothetical protein
MLLTNINIHHNFKKYLKIFRKNPWIFKTLFFISIKTPKYKRKSPFLFYHINYFFKYIPSFHGFIFLLFKIFSKKYNKKIDLTKPVLYIENIKKNNSLNIQESVLILFWFN